MVVMDTKPKWGLGNSGRRWGPQLDGKGMTGDMMNGRKHAKIRWCSSNHFCCCLNGTDCSAAPAPSVMFSPKVKTANQNSEF